MNSKKLQVEQPRVLRIMAVEEDHDGDDDVIPGPPTMRHGHPSFSEQELLDMSLTEHHIKGDGILASVKDLNMDPQEFAAGCVLLQAAARGDLSAIKRQLLKHPHHVNFRDCECTCKCFVTNGFFFVL